MFTVVEPSDSVGERPSEVVGLMAQCAHGLPESLADTTVASTYAAKICAMAYAVEYRPKGSLDGLLSFYANNLETRRGFITMVAVRPELRGRGIGRQMMEACFDELRRLGFTEVALKVLRWNERAIGLYRSSGFEEIGGDEVNLEMLAPIT